MADSSLLIGDIGGTNARFALADRNLPGFTDAMTLQCANYDSTEAAIKHYLDSVGATSPDVICLAAAGPVVGQRVRMTNNHWTLASDELASEFSANAVRLLNDFEAIAYSVPMLASSDCEAIGLPDPEPLPDEQYTVAIVGPGTGLGAVGLRRQGGLLVPIAGEASHGGFAPETRVQLDVLLALRERFDRVSTERLVSGPGIENIYGALASIHGVKLPRLSAAEIFTAADDKSDPHAVEAVSLFFEVLGQFAGDFALALGATDGVFVAGGIVKRYPDLLANSRFRSGFESKGRYRALMERVPTQLVLHDQPGLLGASYCALQMLQN
ncbi:MAG: glucokinase [Gammaproteobacteria bacterium]|nr:glucokinase [Gammaproteobacteria bacterium]MDH3416345.1 glucokinase [Gammaproteobacteria bacterium]